MNPGATDTQGAGRRLAGTILAAFGRSYLVECELGLLECVPRAKRSVYACGDRVAATTTAPRQGVLDACEPRQSLYRRSVEHRTKLIAANATRLAVVVATDPSFSDELLARFLLAAEDGGLGCLVLLNKADLTGQLAQARERLAPFEAAGYRVEQVSALSDPRHLASLFSEGTTLLVGQSGMGKSTIVNALVPEANAAVDEISRFLHSGRHTTTHARLYRLASGAEVIDSPGVQTFGLAHMDRAAVEHGFPELRPLYGTCRFSDCRHEGEPGCAVRAAVDSGALHPRRHELFMRIAREASARSREAWER